MAAKLILRPEHPVPQHLLPGRLIKIFYATGEYAGVALWVPPTLEPNRAQIHLGRVKLRLVGRCATGATTYDDWIYLRLYVDRQIPAGWLIDLNNFPEEVS